MLDTINYVVRYLDVNKKAQLSLTRTMQKHAKYCSSSTLYNVVADNTGLHLFSCCYV